MVTGDTELSGKVDKEEEEHADAHDEEKTTNKDCNETVSCPVDEAIFRHIMFRNHIKVG